MKIGRNDPCPCGSGKKYKKCCMKKENQPVDLLWHRLGNVHDQVVNDLLDYAENHISPLLIPLAMDDFLFWPEVESPEQYQEMISDHQQFFWPWFLFNWVCDLMDAEEFDIRIPEEKTIAEIYMNRRGKKLDSLYRRFIETTGRQPFSFYEVVSCQPGQGYRLRDIFTGEETDVLEKMGSEKTRQNDILLCRIIQIDHVAMVIGNSSFIISPRYKPIIIQLRKQIKRENRNINNRVLRDYDFEIRELYMDIYESAFQPPQLQNTDGEPFSFQTLHFDINDPENAFNQLCGLSAMATPEELRQYAKIDKNGHVLAVEIDWSCSGNKMHKEWSNTILGRIEIKGHKLTIEVNSEARAKKIKKEIQKRMGKDAVYKTTEIQSPEAMMKQMENKDSKDAQTDMDHQELMKIPEVRQQVEDMMTAHWEGWIDQKIPALGGKTPRQAVKSPDGKESVEALLAGAVQGIPDDPFMALGIIDKGIERVRQRLGLDKKKSGNAQEALHEKLDQSVSAIMDLIRDFSQDHLDKEHTGFALKLCDRIADTDSLNIHRGRMEIWAASIVYVICRLNFLFDSDSDLHLTPDIICDYFNTVKSTVGNKASLIMEECELFWDDENLCRQEIVDMFSYLETPEGFIIPKTERPVSSPSRDNGKTKSKEKKSNKKPEPEDDRQRSLFDDF